MVKTHCMSWAFKEKEGKRERKESDVVTVPSLRRGSRRVVTRAFLRALAPWIPRVAGARVSSGSQSC